MFTSLATIVLIVCTSVFTLAAALIDYRTQRIPNKLTLPMFAAGWVYQLAFNQLAGLGDGLAGFAIGFGMFFVLWLIGGGGGGDAKLVGAVSVWLGFKMTLALIIVSTILVILGTGVLMLYGMITKGVYRTKRDFLPAQNDAKKADGKKKKSPMELLQFNRGRKGMTYGLSVAIATVLVVTLAPFVEANHKEKQAKEAEKAANAERVRADNEATNTTTGNDDSEDGEKAATSESKDPESKDPESKDPESKEPVTKNPESKETESKETESKNDVESKNAETDSEK